MVPIILLNRYAFIHVEGHPRCDGGEFIKEHRYVMEQFISSLLDVPFILSSVQIVHHINGVKSDNRLENLLLFENNSKHMKFHAALERFKKNYC
jgi:hypothetical protein